MNRRELLAGALLSTAGSLLGRAGAGERPRIPEKLVVLTFDDAVKSHRAFVAPLLKENGFRATFFVTHAWMDDAEHFLSWSEIAEIQRMGFEIGNHTWTHSNFAEPAKAAKLVEELKRVDAELETAGAAKPVSFAWPGNGFGPEAVEALKTHGIKLARRGMQPEKLYGKIQVGPAFDPAVHHPLLIPTTGDAYPDWSLDHFKRVVARAVPGRAAVIQFHGVPDISHPWVHTPPERFREYVGFLKQNGYRAVAMRELLPYLDLDNPPSDPLLKARYPERA